MKHKDIYISMFTALVIVSGAIFISRVSATVPGTNILISHRFVDDRTGDHTSTGPVISSNGKFVAFSSIATNLLTTTSSGTQIEHVYLNNLKSGVMSQIDVSTAGTPADANAYISARGSISATGRYVIFVSQASNLIDSVITPTTNQQLYLRDTINHTTTLVSKNSQGDIANGNSMVGEGVSSDGRFILFTTNATNLDPDVVNGMHAYMLDRSTGSISAIDRDVNGNIENTSASFPVYASMSCDGSLIAFQGTNNLTNGSSSHVDIYLLDRRAGGTLISLTGSSDGAALAPTVSCNGDYVTFESHADDLDMTNPVTIASRTDSHPYLYDRVNQDFHVMDTVSDTGMPSSPGICPQIGQGTYPISCGLVSDTGVVAFTAASAALTGSVNTSQVYVHNVFTNTTELLSRGADGTVANQTSSAGAITADGTKVVFSSSGTNLVPNQNDLNSSSDVFMALTGE